MRTRDRRCVSSTCAAVIIAAMACTVANAEGSRQEVPFIDRLFRAEFLDTLLRDTGTVSQVVLELNSLAVRDAVLHEGDVAPDSANWPAISISKTRLVFDWREQTSASSNLVVFRSYWYASARIDGHSPAYCLTNVLERGRQTFREAMDDRLCVLRQHQDVPPSWLREGPLNRQYYVKDGETVWIFDLSRGSGWPAMDYFAFRPTKHDPRELEAGFPGLLETALSEAGEVVKARGGPVSGANCVAMDILRRKYGIAWRGPVWVQIHDPDVIVD